VRLSTTRVTRIAIAVCTAGAVLLATTACSSASDGATGATSAAVSTGTIADAAAMTPDELRAYQGASSARLADTALTPVATDPTPTLPVTVTDSQGTKVTVTDTSRILTLDVYGTLSRIVYELGLGSSMVGRDTSSNFAEIADLPNVTPGGHEVTAEAILALSPSVIVTDTSIGPWDVILQMRDAGIPVVVVDSERSLDNVGALTNQVAAALGVPDAGKTLADRTQQEVDAETAAIAKVAPATEGEKLRTVFLYVRGQSGVYYLFGEGSGADALIDGIGGYDVAKEIGWEGMRPVTDEAIIAAQPEVILMMTKGLESVGGVSGLLEKLPALAQTPAGQHQRIIDMPDSEILSFGPQSAQVLDAVAQAMYAPQQHPVAVSDQ